MEKKNIGNWVAKPGCLDVVVVLVIASIFYGFQLGKRSFENHDHQLYAFIADEMLQTRDWLVMRTGEDLYARKPHLLFWAICLFSSLKGEVTPFSARLPCVLSAIGTCVVTFVFAQKWLSRRAAYLASFMLMGTWAFSWNARRVQFDIVLTFFLWAALFFLYAGYKSIESDNRGKRYYFIAGFAISLAVLSKGPAGIMFSLVPFGIFLVIQKNFRRHLGGLVCAIAPLFLFISMWLLAYIRAVGAKEILGTFSREMVGHLVDKSDQWERLPFYYYLRDIPSNFAPWSIFIPALAVFLYHLFRREKSEVYLFLVVWVTTVVLLLSTAYSKTSRYSFPTYPALALMVAGVSATRIDEGESMKQWTRRLLDYPALWSAIGIFVGMVGILVFSLLFDQFHYLLWMCLLFCALILPLTISMRRTSADQRFMRSLVIMIVFMLFFNWAYIAYLTANDDRFSPMKMVYRQFGEEIKQGRVATYNFSSPDLNFYSHRRIPAVSDSTELADYLEKDERVYCLIREYDVPGLPEEMIHKLKFLSRTEVQRNKSFFMVSNY